MAAAAHGWYLRNTYLENNLIKPGKIHLKGDAIDLGRIGWTRMQSAQKRTTSCRGTPRGASPSS